jgi:ParB-like chromosome segregation protein Spo0J
MEVVTMEYEIRKRDSLIDYARNPRKNDHAVDAIASAIKEFGFRVPVLIKSDGSVIDGHLRLKAAKKIGLDDIPTLICDDLSDTQIKALRLSVNRMAELAEWDMDLLSLEIQELDNMEFDVDLLGFDDITKILEDQPETSIKDADGAKEFDESEFSEFDNTCPKCGFEFDDKK